ncbi:MAG: DUF1501 domain-containing protein [Gammaproteobacteria bacterium]|nr:DUF1501 domain-containing protein [Gammaproteobacteria bacterium]
MTTRRQFLVSGLGSAASLAAGVWLPRVSLAATGGDRRFVLVILRGAVDGLSLVPPWGDPDYVEAREVLALARPDGSEGSALPLHSIFGLHPALAGIHALYGSGELLAAHALATPYRDRSHFDGQNVLESGGDRPSGAAVGWLNRALVSLGPAPHEARLGGLAIGQNVPLVLRGPVEVASWSSSVLPEVEPDLIARLRDLYSNDSLLAARLDEAMRIDALADAGGMMRAPGKNAMQLRVVARAAGRMLAAPAGPRIAVMDATGWDTHASEGAAQGVLASRLRGLDGALLALKEGLGPAWSRTIVLVCTEFGRTVAVNGTRGTDHGTGAAALMLGGAVRGGRVLADWPGLAPSARRDGRDLRPTMDVRALFAGVLRDHLGVPESALPQVFPGRGRVVPIRDLVGFHEAA